MIKKVISPFRGEIWYINLDPTVGHEQAKKRPCLIVSNNKFNQGGSELIIVVPLTSKLKTNPLHVFLSSQESGLKVDSYILCDQIRTVSQERIHGTSLGIISQAVMRQVEYALKVVLDMY